MSQFLFNILIDFYSNDNLFIYLFRLKKHLWNVATYVVWINFITHGCISFISFIHLFSFLISSFIFVIIPFVLFLGKWWMKEYRKDNSFCLG